ncbi:NmrA-like family protein [Pedococcus cremeus]|uniref:NmrA-like family protein n=1 Tax=Pedococcus cremeus TaxID=587636 RepID=A0A1H9XS04_9MICO|nr:NmrA-like family protein [Pedococcus cremeus]
MSVRVLAIGASGYLGRAVTQHLLEEDHGVLAMVRQVEAPPGPHGSLA